MAKSKTSRPSSARPSVRPRFRRMSDLPELSDEPVGPAVRRGRHIALGVLMVLSFVTVAWIASPLWVGLMLGAMMAFSAQPLQSWLARRLGGRHVLAAVVTTVVGGLVTAAVVGFSGYVLVTSFLEVVTLLKQHAPVIAKHVQLGASSTHMLQRLGIDRHEVVTHLQEWAARASGYLADAAGVILQTTTSALLSFVIALFAMYYVLLNWPTITMRLERILPLDPHHTRALMQEFRDVGRGAFIGSIATAMVQGVFAGIGFAIVGVPHAATWGLLTAIGSFVPVVGTALVWTPVGLYLLVVGSVPAGIFVLAWGGLVVMGVADYIIRPRLVGGHGAEQPFLTLIALLGGIEVFGLAGLIVGPVLMSLFQAILRIYEREAVEDQAAERQIEVVDRS